ncbi:bifunctional ADP-dependent NAD(P)H-hydrate dehydratase/NAD(P)H-hydrate epimerase [Halococcus agarilyticus]|uniref:bifunctional ADP-dependent NAD(P)H-hydrate dehydratase/NAD(P)H-hydrate epimerase n=1 Tax=Halococcus agarilyticus TaxID=1232219 RepID=UPI000677FA7B|nr:bifunctional ADP-dependent NAD(P)H-hydrate dehydratase/NAD(P)H-hydrate epimerase [Halococcus agarilyticus]
MIATDRMAAVDANAAALGVPRKQLMESSGNAVARVVRDIVEPGAQVTIVAGRGNNGGDAFVAARFLDEHDTRTRLLGRAATIATEIARENWDALQEGEYDATEVRDSRDLDLGDPDVVVDAMLGTGVTGALREPEATAAEAINATDATVVAVDVPSGVDADTGEATSGAIEADSIVTFHDEKPGLGELDAAVRVVDIGIPRAAERFVGPGDLRTNTRDPHAAKGDSGRVLVIGGGPYTGAPALAAEASLRAGADLAFVSVPQDVFEPIAGYAEDLIVQPYDAEQLSPDQVEGLVETATDHDDVVVLGPGLGTADETLEAVREFLREFDGLAVIDADALSVVPEVDTDATLVCTPNRHELAEMGGPAVDDLRSATDEIASFADELGHVVLAKAKDDVISNGETTRICRAGTPGMTVGGTGDVLAGITAALLATHDPYEAACMAPYVNGRAAEHLGRGDGLLASELLDAVPNALRDDDDE